MLDFKPNHRNLKVLGPDGWVSFAGVAYMGEKEIITIELENGYSLDCTADHKIYTSMWDTVEARHLVPGSWVRTLNGPLRVVKSTSTGERHKVYDLISVDGTKFIANSFVISNCEFISVDETLISGMKLLEMQGGHPNRKSGQVRWYEPLVDGMTYLIGLDPALGTGGDYAAIQVYSIPDLIQVGEYQSNIETIQRQVHIMRDVLEEIELQCPESDIYYTIENNGLGHAAVEVLMEMTRNTELPGTLMNEPRKTRKNNRLRKGYTTTHGSKMAACIKLKKWIENNMMQVNSMNLVRELKTFIARGNSFSAKDGETDDLVDATLLVVRMAMEISKYDDGVLQELKDSFDDGDYREPMPFIMS